MISVMGSVRGTAGEMEELVDGQRSEADFNDGRATTAMYRPGGLQWHV